MGLPVVAATPIGTSSTSGAAAHNALVSNSVQAAVASSLQGLLSGIDSRIQAAIQTHLPMATAATQAAVPPLPPADSSPTPSTRSSATGTMAGGGGGSSMSSGLTPAPASLAHIPLFSVPSDPSLLHSSASIRQGRSATVHSAQSIAPPLASTIPPSVADSPPPLATVGPNSTPIPQKIMRKIWNGEYIDMAELLPEKLHTGPQQEPHSADARKPRRKRVTSILQWVECFNAFIGVMLAYHPSRASDLLGYSSLIVHAARKYKGDNWMQYDSNFRKRAAAFPTERWAEINPTLWQLAFANASPRSHCELCFSLDHLTEHCDEFESASDTASTSKKGLVSEPSLLWERSGNENRYAGGGICLSATQQGASSSTSVWNVTNHTRPRTAPSQDSILPANKTASTKTREGCPFSRTPLPSGRGIHTDIADAHPPYLDPG